MAQAGAQARPAEPLLASSLIGDEELEGVVAGSVGPRQKRRGESLRTGVKSVDEALEGGLEGGQVVGVSAGQGGSGVEVGFSTSTRPRRASSRRNCICSPSSC